MLRPALLLLAFAPPATADCRLALALAVDVSRSIDATDYVIQTEGLAAALEDREVRKAIFGPEGEVALAIFYWSGNGYQDLVQSWVILDGPEALDAAIQYRVRHASGLHRIIAFGSFFLVAGALRALGITELPAGQISDTNE